MGRNQRIHFPGAIYHVMARGVDGRKIFIDDQDCKTFLNVLFRIESESASDVLAYCLMVNHFHLAIRVGTVKLASIMQRVLTSYARTFNRRFDRTGHLFQARYKAITCLNDAYLANLTNYIHLNPVRAGLVINAEDWPWSSLHGAKMPAMPGTVHLDFDPWPEESKSEASLLRYTNEEKPEIQDLASVVVTKTGVALEELRSSARRHKVIAARRLLTQEAISAGHQLVAVARWLNTTSCAVTRYARGITANTEKPDTHRSKRAMRRNMATVAAKSGREIQGEDADLSA